MDNTTKIVLGVGAAGLLLWFFSKQQSTSPAVVRVIKPPVQTPLQQVTTAATALAPAAASVADAVSNLLDSGNDASSADAGLSNSDAGGGLVSDDYTLAGCPSYGF